MKNKGKLIESALLTAYKIGGVLKAESGTNTYNIFTDPLSYKARDAHRKSLEDFIAKNPTIGSINTKDFADFFSQLAGLEGSYNPLAGEGMKYSGYYGLEGGRNLSSHEQHKKAFNHLNNIFKNQMVKEDLERGIELGFTPAQILAKYWNQGNRVTNYLHNGVDNEDGIGTKISTYGNNMNADLDYSKYLQNGITDPYIIVKKWNDVANASKFARNKGMDYSNRDSSIASINTKMLRHKKQKNSLQFDPTKVRVGDTLYLDSSYVEKLINKNK